MGVGRRSCAAAVLSGLVLLAGPAAAQDAPDDPCALPPAVAGEPAPTPDPMCQSGAPVQDAGSSAGSGERTADPVEELPFTGPDERAVLLGSLGAGLLLVGAGLFIAGRRRA